MTLSILHAVSHKHMWLEMPVNRLPVSVAEFDTLPPLQAIPPEFAEEMPLVALEAEEEDALRIWIPTPLLHLYLDR